MAKTRGRTANGTSKLEESQVEKKTVGRPPNKISVTSNSKDELLKLAIIEEIKSRGVNPYTFLAQQLVDVCQDPIAQTSSRLKALEEVLNRLVGKPAAVERTEVKEVYQINVDLSKYDYQQLIDLVKDDLEG